MAVIVALGACGALGGTAVSASASASSADARLGRALSALVRMPGGPPGIVSVVQRGGRREVFRRGVANLRTGARIRLGDHWRIASVSKAFSGAVALRLVAEGKLSLDDTIASRLSGLPAAWGSVTLAQALQHVSGLPDYSTSPAFQNQLRTAPRAPLMPAALISFVADQPLDFPPGSAYHYSNTDNFVVALFAEAATGLSYERCSTARAQPARAAAYEHAARLPDAGRVMCTDTTTTCAGPGRMVPSTSTRARSGPLAGWCRPRLT